MAAGLAAGLASFGLGTAPLVARFEGGGAIALGAGTARVFERILAEGLGVALAALLTAAFAAVFAAGFAAALAAGRFGVLPGALLAGAFLDLIRGIGMNLRFLDRLCHRLLREWLSGPGPDCSDWRPTPYRSAPSPGSMMDFATGRNFHLVNARPRVKF